MTWKRGEMCGSCAGRKGTDANVTAETLAVLAECIKTGEPFYCHESTAELDPNGTAVDRFGNRYRHLPFERWRLCRAWTNAKPDCPVFNCAFGREGFAGRHPCQQHWAGDPQAHREYLRGCRLIMPSK